jgi:hypothetical protein
LEPGTSECSERPVNLIPGEIYHQVHITGGSKMPVKDDCQSADYDVATASFVQIPPM